MSSGIVFPLRPSAPRTSVTGSSPLLPMPVAGDGRVKGGGGRWSPTSAPLEQTIKDELALLPTPTAHERTQTPRPVDHGRRLANEIALLPTPVANDDNKSPEAHLAMKRRMSERDGSNRTQITSLAVLARAGFQQPIPSAARVERPRLSALGDGVQVQIGRIAGEYIVGLERERLSMRSAA